MDEAMTTYEQNPDEEKEIMEHTEGYLFDDSTELIRQIREERSRYLEEL